MSADRQGPELACQLLLYPVADHDFDTPSYRDNGEGYFLTRSMMEWFWSQYLGGDASLAERSEEHTSELQSRGQLVCRLLLEKQSPSSYKTSYRACEKLYEDRYIAALPN